VPIDADGCVAPPNFPGSGERYDWEELEKAAYLKI
jgi:hypothetical protein